MRQSLVAAVVAILLCAGARADEVCLKDGGCLHGVIVQRTASTITIEIGPGKISLPMSRVERFSEGRSSLASFNERRRRLDPRDVQGWLELARWAQDRGLATQARAAYEHVVELDPDNPEANRALGKTLVGEQWLDQEDAYRARGYTYFEGAWIPRAERDARLEKRRIETDAAIAEAAQAEASARRAEAEARARLAEAELDSAVEPEQEDSEGYWGWGLGDPYFTGQPYPRRRVKCGPNMSGPACRSENDRPARQQNSHVRPSPRRSATPRPSPVPAPKKKRNPRARLPAGD